MVFLPTKRPAAPVNRCMAKRPTGMSEVQANGKGLYATRLILRL